MTPARSHTIVPGHIGSGCLTLFPSPETFVRLIPQEPVVEHSLSCLSLSDIIKPPIIDFELPIRVLVYLKIEEAKSLLSIKKE